MNKLYLIVMGAMLLLLSCHKETLPDIPQSEGVYIINEGNFNFGNAEVSFYDPATQQVTNQLFQAANGYSLGDVAQSMYLKDSLGFIVVNNSSKVEVVRIPSFHKVHTLTIPGSNPRYFLPLDDSLAYVTELYAHVVYVVNYRTGALLTTVAVPQYTEHLLRTGDAVLVEGKRIYSNPGSHGALMRLDARHHTLTDTVQLNGDAGGLAMDKDGYIWIAVNTDSASGQHAALLCYNAQLQEVARYDFTSPDIHPDGLCADATGEHLYFLSGGIYRFTVADRTLVQLVPPAANYFYGLSVDPLNGDIYASDALDFVQPSRIYRYTANGELVHSFTAGINSGNFAFSHE